MSDLLKISRAMQDQHFQWRVNAAMLLQAQTVYTSATATNREKAFALSVLSNPEIVDASTLALVASDSAVIAKVTLSGTDNEIAKTDGVLDADIRRVVAATWSAVSTKYGTGPGGNGAAA